MSVDPRVLVAGATGDYINWITQHCSRRALFLTDYQIRKTAKEPPPDLSGEVLADLTNLSESRAKLFSHLDEWNQRLIGVTCFDDEALELAAILAQVAGLPFTSAESVRNSRCKLKSKQLWKKAGVSCPGFYSLPVDQDNGPRPELTFPCMRGAFPEKNR